LTSCHREGCFSLFRTTLLEGRRARARARARGPVRCSSKHVVISSARTYIVQLIPDLALTRVRVSCIVVIVDHVEHVLFPRVVHAFFSPCGTCVVVISPMRYMHDTCILHNFLMFELCLRVYIAFSVSHCLIYQVASGINSVFGVFVMSCHTYSPYGRAYSLESTRSYQVASGMNSVFGAFVMSCHTYSPNGRAYSLEFSVWSFRISASPGPFIIVGHTQCFGSKVSPKFEFDTVCAIRKVTNNAFKKKKRKKRKKE